MCVMSKEPVQQCDHNSNCAHGYECKAIEMCPQTRTMGWKLKSIQNNFMQLPVLISKYTFTHSIALKCLVETYK